MFLTMSVIGWLFTGTVIYLARRAALRLEESELSELAELEHLHEQLTFAKEKAMIEKVALEKEAAQIFTLYEMTREITKNFNEEDALNIFKLKLKENVSFGDIRLTDVLPERTPEKAREDVFIFALPGDQQKVRYLIVEGVSKDAQDKVLILAHQFALALRRLRLYQEIEKLAITDSLTGVHTRRYFLERFEEELKRAVMRKMSLSLFMIDVDHFKNFNDQYGHLTGDQILKEIGEIIRQNIREIDIAGRFGGEEFSVVLPDTNREGAQFAAERIRSAVEKTIIKAYDTTVKTTVSIGTTTFPQDGISGSELFDRADWSLYRAKKMGRNCICAFGVYKDGDPSAF